MCHLLANASIKLPKRRPTSQAQNRGDVSKRAQPTLKPHPQAKHFSLPALHDVLQSADVVERWVEVALQKSGKQIILFGSRGQVRVAEQRPRTIRFHNYHTSHQQFRPNSTNAPICRAANRLDFVHMVRIIKISVAKVSQPTNFVLIKRHTYIPGTSNHKRASPIKKKTELRKIWQATTYHCNTYIPGMI